MTRRLTGAFLVLAAVLGSGTLGFHFIQGWSYLDSLYMTVITVGTVGFREIGTLSPAGRVFTMALIFAGIASLGFALGTFVDFLVEGHLKGIIEERRMQRLLNELRGHTIVAGMGRVGEVVARSMAEEGAGFVVIDTCVDCVQRAHDAGWLVLHGDATDEQVLIAAGVERAKGLVTALDSDADNLFVTVSARTLNPDVFIVSRSGNESTEAKLRKAGANRVITPNVIGGRRMANMVLHPIVSDYLDLVTRGDGVEFRLEEIEVRQGTELSGMTIGDAKVRDRTGAYILAVHGADGTVSTSPTASTVIAAGDRLVVLGTIDQLRAIGALV